VTHRAAMLACAISLASAGSLACASGAAPPVQSAAAPLERITADSTAATAPAGLGTLRQDDIAIVLQPQGVRVTAIPLDENVIRTLAPDSYRSLRTLLESRRQEIMRRAAMHGVREPRVWYVLFYGLAPDARFIPTDVSVSSAGRDYRPFDVVAISPAFGTQRLQPRETQKGLLLFDDGLDVSQPLVVTMGAERNSDWDTILRKIDAERAAIRARASARTMRP
jgi:hypothetical protein